MNTTKMAITLAAPLEAPVLNFDNLINDYYLTMDVEWNMRRKEMESKLLLSFGSGARDVLVPSSLTSCEESDIKALVCIFQISVPIFLISKYSHLWVFFYFILYIASLHVYLLTDTISVSPMN